MSKIVIIGAGSKMFTRDIVAGLLIFNDVKIDTIALVDINQKKLDVMERLTRRMVEEEHKAIKIQATKDRREVLKGANYVCCAIDVGGLEAFKLDLAIPDKYGVDFNVGDTLGAGGTFRALRTTPEIIRICKDMEELCPEAIFFQYSNPMAPICMAIERATKIKTYGVCRSPQGTALQIANYLEVPVQSVSFWCAGINHMSWYLELKVNGKDAYPGLRKLASDKAKIATLRQDGTEYEAFGVKVIDTVRFQVMQNFGYFVTESPFHMSEYTQYFRKNKAQIDALNVSERWWIGAAINADEVFKNIESLLASKKTIEKKQTQEYAPNYIRAIETGESFRGNLNVPNTGLITNLPNTCCVEVPCFVDSLGIHPCYVGTLPEQCAALNRSNVNVQEMIVQAILKKDRECAIQAIKLDPLTSALLTLDKMDEMAKEMFHAQQQWLPGF